MILTLWGVKLSYGLSRNSLWTSAKKKTGSSGRNSKFATLTFTTRFGSEPKRCVSEFYVSKFSIYSTMKHPSYKAAQQLFAHPVAWRLMMSETRALGTYCDTKPKNKPGLLEKTKQTSCFIIRSIHLISLSWWNKEGLKGGAISHILKRREMYIQFWSKYLKKVL